MPIYEYRCVDCKRYASIFVPSVFSEFTAACTHCGSQNMRRLVSRFAVVRSEESRLENMADPSSFGDLDENDPKSVARWARKMGQEMGEDLGPEFGDMVDRMEAGEMPDDVEGGGPGGEGGGLGDDE